MSHQTNTDNSFELGTIVFAKAFPTLKLVVIKYYQRIYYCAEVNSPSKRHLAYFENELCPL